MNQYRIDKSILCDFQRWKSSINDESLTIWSYINYHTSCEFAVAISLLFWPEFIEVDGCVFFADMYDESSYNDWKKRLENNRIDIEAVVNHIHIYDLFTSNNSEMEDSCAATLSHVLIEVWQCALYRAFPEKIFIFEYTEDYGPTVSFHQAS